MQSSNRSVAVLISLEGFSVLAHDGTLNVSVNLYLYDRGAYLADSLSQAYLSLLRTSLSSMAMVEQYHPRGIAPLSPTSETCSER
jgi:hypothetical protein